MLANDTYHERMLKKFLNQMDSVYYDIQGREEFYSGAEPDMEFEIETDELKDDFQNIAESVYKSCVAYFEIKGLTKYLQLFIQDLYPFFLDRKKMLSGGPQKETGDMVSDLVAKFWEYLKPFIGYEVQDDSQSEKETGLAYLENILHNTAVIVDSIGIVPTKEAEVYNSVKIVCKATFADASFPSESFQKISKNYKPDILIPSLNCAVEYKYAENEPDLIRTIDEILVDVAGYGNNTNYKIFYAVFFVSPNIWPPQRFSAVWQEKQFPSNWNGIMVVRK